MNLKRFIDNRKNRVMIGLGILTVLICLVQWSTVQIYVNKNISPDAWLGLITFLSTLFILSLIISIGIIPILILIKAIRTLFSKTLKKENWQEIAILVGILIIQCLTLFVSFIFYIPPT
jgi:hypothetical protein